MESAVMGKVFAKASISNLSDLCAVDLGTMTPDQVRSIEIADALVDTGAIMLSLPKRFIQRLGLKRYGTRKVRTTGGVVEAGVYGVVLCTIQDRDCRVDVLEVPDDSPALIGQIPLEALDFVVNPVSGKLEGNPEHGGEHMVDAF